MALTVVAALGVLGGVCFSAAPALAETNYGLSGSFGSEGTGAGMLKEPAGVAVSEVGATKGDVYVVDAGNKRVEYFSATGAYLGQFNGSGLLAGEEGKKAPNPLLTPESIAVDNDPSSPSVGDVYATDTIHNTRPGRNVIDKFSPTGAYETQLTGTCQKPGESPPACPASSFIAFGGFLRGVAVDHEGNLWAYGDSSEEAFQGPIYAAQTFVAEFSDTGSFEKGFTGIDVLEGKTISAELGMAVDSSDDVYVSGYHNAATGYGRVTAKYNSSGVALEEGPGDSALAIGSPMNNLFLDTGASVAEYGPLGFGEPPIAVFPSKGFGGSEGIAVSDAGTVYATQRGADNVAIFTVGATPTAPVTEETKEITATSATLHGELRGGETEYYFEYNDNGGCTGSGKTSPVASTATGAKVSADVTGLDPSASYLVCLVSENPFGKTAGSAEPFTTAGVVPEIIAGSESASNVGRPEGVFTAVINPNNQETQYSVEYSTEGSTTGDTLEGEVNTVEGTPLPAEFGDESVSIEARLAERSATYYYRIVARNATGEAIPGEVQSYTKLPVVGGGSVSELTSTTATLQATLYPDFQNTTYVWEYAAEAALLGTPSATKVAGPIYIQGNEEPAPPTPLGLEIASLQPESIYYYRLVAENETTENPSNLNEGKPVDGAIHSFRTLAVPLASTGEAQAITRTTAALSGTVNPEGAETTYYFAYITQAGYERALAGDAAEKANPYTQGETTEPASAGSGVGEQSLGPIFASGLLPGTTYDYALVAKNSVGVKIGPPRTLTTSSRTPPIVGTGGVSGVSQNGATISGTVTTNGLQTNYGFEIGTEPGNYGPPTGLGSIGGANTEVVSLTLSELQPGTTYYYRVTARNADGASQGAPGMFSTPGFPVLLVEPSVLPQLASPVIAFPVEEKATAIAPVKVLSEAEKLKRALKACRREKSKAKRAKCEKQARKQYSPAKKAKARKKG